MDEFSVALVARDPGIRSLLARTFEGAPATWKVELHEERPERADLVITTDGAPGDLVFDPDDPERALVEARARAAARRTAGIYLITGAASGCGVTSVALHLACAFARRAETCLVDLDTRWRGVAERLDLLGEETKTWADAGEDEESLRLAALPVRGGFRVLLAPESSVVPTTVDGVNVEPPAVIRRAANVDPSAVIRRAAQQFARVVVDLPAAAPATADALTDPSLAATSGVIVAPATRGGARRAASLLQTNANRRWALVLNRLGAGGEESAARLARRAGRSAVLELPCTPTLRDAEEEGRLLEASWTRWSRRIDRLARALERT